jgi:hypothetical protein
LLNRLVEQAVVLAEFPVFAVALVADTEVFQCSPPSAAREPASDRVTTQLSLRFWARRA